jgi:hypothetical protein
MGTPGPRILQDFRAERAFWQQLGLTREAARERSWQEMRDYALIIQLEQREENKRRPRR